MKNKRKIKSMVVSCIYDVRDAGHKRNRQVNTIDQRGVGEVIRSGQSGILVRGVMCCEPIAGANTQLRERKAL